jgi:hypothetical protein
VLSDVEYCSGLKMICAGFLGRLSIVIEPNQQQSFQISYDDQSTERTNDVRNPLQHL